MKYSTLLRYPGGKSRAVNILLPMLNSVIDENSALISPFFGGGAIELAVLNQNIPVKGNDAFKCLAVFWNILNTDPHQLSDLIVAQWHKGVSKTVFNNFQQHLEAAECSEDEKILNNPKIAAMLYIVNRCSFSGATLSGGFSASAAKDRFTLSGIEKIRNWQKTDLLTVECENFVNFLPKHISKHNIWFIDPPYLLGDQKEKLYGVRGSYHEGFQHQQLQQLIQQQISAGGKILLTYNDCEEVRDLYSGINELHILPATWKYGMSSNKTGKEIIITNIQQL